MIRIRSSSLSLSLSLNIQQTFSIVPRGTYIDKYISLFTFLLLLHPPLSLSYSQSALITRQWEWKLNEMVVDLFFIYMMVLCWGKWRLLFDLFSVLRTLLKCLKYFEVECKHWIYLSFTLFFLSCRFNVYASQNEIYIFHDRNLAKYFLN